MEALGVVSIEGLLLLFIKASLAVLVAMYMVGQFSRSPASVRHQIWLGLLIVLSAIPLWSWLAPKVHLPLVSPEWDTTTLPWAGTLVYAYLTVVFVRTAGLLASIIRVAWISLNSVEAGRDWRNSLAQFDRGNRVVLRASDELDTPITLGFLKPLILVPMQLQASKEERRMILQHELEHIRRADWLTQLLAQLVGILFWPVPGVRRALGQLSLEAEQACDDRVLESEGDAAEYAALLLKQARSRHLAASVALGRPSELALRISNLCEPAIDHRPAGSHTWMVPLCILLALPVASLQLSARPSAIAAAPTAVGVSLGRFVQQSSSKPVFQVSLPARPLEVARPPHLSYVVAVDTLELPNPYTHANPPAPGPELGIGEVQEVSRHGKPLTTPRYPEHARRRGLEGDVVVIYDLTSAGGAANVRIHSANPPGVFEQSVIEALPSAQGDQSDLVLKDLETAYRFRLRDSRARASPH